MYTWYDLYWDIGMTEWINLILTALASMGVGGVGAIWYSKRKAKAEVSNVEAQTGQAVAQRFITRGKKKSLRNGG